MNYQNTKGLTMIKKLTLASVATLALIMIPAQAEGMKCQAGKCGAGMMKQAKQGKVMHQKKKNSPFLIKHGLPHMTKMIMKSWDDSKLALNEGQKTKLLVVRKETMAGVMRLKPEITALEKEIITASKAGTKAADLKTKVEKLAVLESELTMVHLQCIEDSNTILNEEQVAYLMDKKETHKSMKKDKMKAMKCQAGKCGGNR